MKPETRRRWTRDELILAMNLYCRIPFGRQHGRAPEVMELARALKRTPDSVAMKLNNLTALDPEERARGLAGASALDREVWNAFHENWEAMSAESEWLWGSMVADASGSLETRSDQRTADERLHEASTAVPGSGAPSIDAGLPSRADSPTEAWRFSRVRLSQAFFRRVVLNAYQSRCCITGNPVPELLEAAHIVSWSAEPTERGNPRNGLCLSRLHHAAFDQGLIAVDEDQRLLVSRRLKDHLPNQAVEANFTCYEGAPLQPPERFRPARELLAVHRATVFVA